MSLAEWYQYKADQSERRAKAATNRAERVDYEDTQKRWLILAAEAELGSGPINYLADQMFG
jgi:hypothetical protein